MKKKLMLRNERSSNSILLRIMKITCTLFFVGILQIFAFNAYSQNARVTMNHVNTPLRVILNDIEKQTNYLFVIINSQVDTQKKYTVQVKSEPVSTVLNALFQGENVVYQLQGNHIVLSREDKKREQKSKRTVTGYIKDHSGEPLVGASILVKGTQQGTVTDLNGYFSLEGEYDESTVLSIRYVGMESKDVAIADKNSLGITERDG